MVWLLTNLSMVLQLANKIEFKYLVMICIVYHYIFLLNPWIDFWKHASPEPDSIRQMLEKTMYVTHAGK